MQVAVKIPSIKAALTDHEYQLITSIAGDNFKEEQRLPESARWLEQYFAQPPEEESERCDASLTQGVLAIPSWTCHGSQGTLQYGAEDVLVQAGGD